MAKRRRCFSAALIAAALAASGGAAGAQGTPVPVPEARPAAADVLPVPAPDEAAKATEGGGGGEGIAKPSAALPSSPAASPPEAAEVPVPAPAPSRPAEPPAEPAPPLPAGTVSPPSDAAQPSAPPEKPAYIPPEAARTTPEPTAPEATPAAVSPEESAEAAAAVADAVACERELTARGVVFTLGDSVSDGACGVLRPVAIERLSSGVRVEPATRMLCRAALALDVWMAEAVLPAAKAELGGARVERLVGGETYACRERASEARISEHGRGSAIDVAGFALSGGRSVMAEAQPPGSDGDRFLATVRRAACGPFRTVLGPGTDADHATHLHLDIAARPNGALYCR